MERQQEDFAALGNFANIGSRLATHLREGVQPRRVTVIGQYVVLFEQRCSQGAACVSQAYQANKLIVLPECSRRRYKEFRHAPATMWGRMGHGCSPYLSTWKRASFREGQYGDPLGKARSACDWAVARPLSRLQAFSLIRETA